MTRNATLFRLLPSPFGLRAGQALFVVLPQLPYLRRLKAFRVSHIYRDGRYGSVLEREGE